MSNLSWESDKPCVGCGTKPPIMAYGIPKRGGILLCDSCSRHLVFGMLRDIAERDVGTVASREIHKLMESENFLKRFSQVFGIVQWEEFPKPRKRTPGFTYGSPKN